jgi:hypothetical protein
LIWAQAKGEGKRPVLMDQWRACLRPAQRRQGLRPGALPAPAPPSQQNEFVRPGFDLGFEEGGKYYVHNHLRFNILVHPTHGEYSRGRQGGRRLLQDDGAGPLGGVGGRAGGRAPGVRGQGRHTQPTRRADAPPPTPSPCPLSTPPSQARSPERRCT